MSSDERPGRRRRELLEGLAAAGREMSDAAVMFHTAVAETLGLGASDWKTLGLLEKYGPLTAGEIAARSGLAPASVTGMVDRLEDGGWVRRRRHPEDGRRVIVELNREAVADMGQVFGGLMRRLDDLYRRYDDDELALLLEFLREIARRQREATAELSAASDRG